MLDTQRDPARTTTACCGTSWMYVNAAIRVGARKPRCKRLVYLLLGKHFRAVIGPHPDIGIVIRSVPQGACGWSRVRWGCCRRRWSVRRFVCAC